MPLDRLSDSDGRLRVLAVDHRDSLKQFIAPDDPDSVGGLRLTEIKTELVRAISPGATGVMLEPEYSIPQLIVNGALAAGTGFICALEAQGYLADPTASPTTLYWTAQQAADAGASAAKLLVPYHPDHELAAAQREVAAQTVEQCAAAGLPLVLEPLFHSLADPSDRERVVLTTVEEFAPLGAALLKLPFPVDPDLVADHEQRRAACAAVTERCQQPWGLLSGGGSFESFEEQVRVATEAGAAGFMVGRALWGDAARAPRAEREAVIQSMVVPRWERLCAAAAAACG